MAKRTPLYDTHCRLGGRIVEFGGFELPVQYTSIRDEHAAVRDAAGLFDVSHMGQIHLRGSDAGTAADRVFSRRASTLRLGRVRYGLLCNDDGGVVDDVTCYRVAEDDWMFCVNAANVDKDYRWIDRHCASGALVENASDTTAMLALQGPASPEILRNVASDAIDSIGRFRCERTEVAGCTSLVSRTGYTGSAGFELYLDASDAVAVFDALLEAGRPLGLLPAGLGARDTLRLEAALPLYGHEIDDTTTPYEAGLGRFVYLNDRDFVGAAALRRASSTTPSRQLVGFIIEGRGIARAGYVVAVGGEDIGVVTSGSPSPTLGKSIGLAYVPPEYGTPGNRVDIIVRGRPVPAQLVDTPFIAEK